MENKQEVSGVEKVMAIIVAAITTVLVLGLGSRIESGLVTELSVKEFGPSLVMLIFSMRALFVVMQPMKIGIDEEE